MPPKSTAATDDADAALPLQEWLKLLQSHGVPMRTAMGLASKVYKTHGSKAKLAKLGDKELAAAVPDKEQRKLVFGALKGIGSGKVGRCWAGRLADSPLQAHTPKRKRDDDLLRGLDPVPAPVPESFDFHEILDPEVGEMVWSSLTQPAPARRKRNGQPRPRQNGVGVRRRPTAGLRRTGSPVHRPRIRAHQQYEARAGAG